MTLDEFLITSIWFLTAAVVFVPLFKRLGLGALLGYMAAGIAIGPSGLHGVKEISAVSKYAELGVVFLLFVIGLELQPRKLWSMRKSVFGLGFFQMFTSTVVLSAGAYLCGLSPLTAVVCGFALSLTSTAFALQIMKESNHLQTDYGQKSFSILLFQDLMAIPALAIIPLFFYQADPASASHLSLPGFLKSFGTIVAVLFLARLLLRPLLRMIAWTQAREIFTATALLFVMGVSLFMESMHVSMSLGAFLAGVLLADSEYRHEIESDIEPFKGLLLGLFFISVGMAVDFQIIFSNFFTIFSMAILLMAAKMAINYGLARASHLPLRSSLNLSVVLSPAGEFGFVIFAVALQGGILTPGQNGILVAVVTLSMMFTPFAVKAQEYLADKYIKDQSDSEFDSIENDHPQVIIAGFGRVGQITARLLRVLWIPFTALELDGEQVQVVRKFGNKVYYGDASRLDLLHAAGAETAEIFVLAIDDPESSLRIVETVKKHFPHLKIVARARNRQHAFELMDLGVNDIYRETLGSSLEMAEDVLNKLGMPSDKARAKVKTFREHDEKNLIHQQSIRDNEKELIAYAKLASDQLEQTLKADF